MGGAGKTKDIHDATTEHGDTAYVEKGRVQRIIIHDLLGRKKLDFFLDMHIG